MNILFTICARAGSKGFQNKNLKTLNGVPLVYYTLAAIRLYQEAHTEDNIVTALNTDSEDLKQIVGRQKYVQPVVMVERRPELADDITPKVEVIKDTYLQCADADDIDVIVDLDITSPLRRVCDIEETIRQVMSTPGCDLAFSVVEARRNPYFNMVEKQGDYYRKVCSSDYTARQQAPAIYELNASIYAFCPEFLQQTIDKTILDYNFRIAVMPDYRVLDIDSEEDYETLQYMIGYYGRKDQLLHEIIRIAEFMQPSE